MNASSQPALLQLRKDEIRRLHGRHGGGIAVSAGEVWLTLDGDPRDIVLTAGESFGFEPGAEAIVQALVPSALLLLDTLTPPRVGDHGARI